MQQRPAAASRRIKPGDVLLKVRCHICITAYQCVMQREFAFLTQAGGRHRLSTPQASSGVRAIRALEQLLIPLQMQKLLLGPASSTVELELRHAGEKSSYNVGGVKFILFFQVELQAFSNVFRYSCNEH
jgi:hypothetical protein